MRSEQTAMRMRSTFAGGLGGTRGLGDVAMLSRQTTQARAAAAGPRAGQDALGRPRDACGPGRGMLRTAGNAHALVAGTRGSTGAREHQACMLC